MLQIEDLSLLGIFDVSLVSLKEFIQNTNTSVLGTVVVLGLTLDSRNIVVDLSKW